MELSIKFARIVVIGFIIAIIYHMVLGLTFGLDWPFNTFLFKPKDRFMDFFNTITHGHAVWCGAYNVGSTYYPFTPGYVWMTAIYGYMNSLLGLFLFSATIILYFGYRIYKTILLLLTPRLAILVTVIMVVTSYPLLVLLDRGNQEGLQFILLSMFVFSFVNKKFYWSIFWLVMAFCMKPFAVVFLGLFLQRDKIKYIVYFVLGVIFVTLVTFSLLPHGFEHNFRSMILGFQNYDTVYVLNGRGMQFNHTMYTILWFANKVFGILDPVHMKNLYLIAMASLFLGLIYYINKLELVLWRKIFILYLAMIGFPFISADYTLVHLYIPASLMFLSFQQNADYESREYYTIITVLLGFLVIPMQYLSGFVIPVGISVIVYPVLIYTLLYVLVRFGLYERRKSMQIGVQS